MRRVRSSGTDPASICRQRAARIAHLVPMWRWCVLIALAGCHHDDRQPAPPPSSAPPRVPAPAAPPPTARASSLDAIIAPLEHLPICDGDVRMDVYATEVAAWCVLAANW